jgi:hypothetical protein
MIVVNLKSPITFRVIIGEKACAFSTKCFRAANVSSDDTRDGYTRTVYNVTDITIDSDTCPWYTFEKPKHVTVLDSHVISVQQEGV